MQFQIYDQKKKDKVKAARASDKCEGEDINDDTRLPDMKQMGLKNEWGCLTDMKKEEKKN